MGPIRRPRRIRLVRAARLEGSTTVHRKSEPMQTRPAKTNRTDGPVPPVPPAPPPVDNRYAADTVVRSRTGRTRQVPTPERAHRSARCVTYRAVGYRLP